MKKPIPETPWWKGLPEKVAYAPRLVLAAVREQLSKVKDTLTPKARENYQTLIDELEQKIAPKPLAPNSPANIVVYEPKTPVAESLSINAETPALPLELKAGEGRKSPTANFFKKQEILSLPFSQPVEDAMNKRPPQFPNHPLRKRIYDIVVYKPETPHTRPIIVPSEAVPLEIKPMEQLKATATRHVQKLEVPPAPSLPGTHLSPPIAQVEAEVKRGKAGVIAIAGIATVAVGYAISQAYKKKESEKPAPWTQRATANPPSRSMA